MSKIKVRYVGTYPIVHYAPGFYGDVLPGEEIEVLESAIHEYTDHTNWEIVKQKKNLPTETKLGGDE